MPRWNEGSHEIKYGAADEADKEECWREEHLVVEAEVEAIFIESSEYQLEDDIASHQADEAPRKQPTHKSAK